MHSHVGPVHGSTTKHPRLKVIQHRSSLYLACSSVQVPVQVEPSSPRLGLSTPWTESSSTSVVIIVPSSAHRQTADKTRYHLGRVRHSLDRKFYNTDAMPAWEHVLIFLGRKLFNIGHHSTLLAALCKSQSRLNRHRLI